MASNVVTINAGSGPAARIEGDTLVLDDFRERDAQVLALVRDADDIDGVVHDCFAIGARALTAAQATTDVAVVEKAFGDMTTAFSQGLDSFAGELDAKTKELLDGEEGSLPRSFEGFKAELEELLDGTFDPDSRLSAIAKIEDVMRRAAADQVKAVRGLIDPDNEESPLGRYRSEIVKSVCDETAKVHKAVQELTTQIAVVDAKAEMFELTTKKGFTFEEALEESLVRICQPHGDIADRVGGTPGVKGRKGDFVVTLNPDDSAGKAAGYVLEAKNQQLNLRDTLREIDGAIVNREALAGIAVFAKGDQCPGDVPFQPFGNRALVVFDPNEDDDVALRLACCWARWVVRRQLGAAGDDIDLDRIGSLIDDARQALRTRSTIDRALTTSANKIGEARGHLGTLVAEVEVALAAIEGEIAA
jgi:hypothetical protein